VSSHLKLQGFGTGERIKARLETLLQSGEVRQHVFSKCVIGGSEFFILDAYLLKKKRLFYIYKCLAVPAFLYGSETWCLTKRDEGRIQIC
jgi:hypothetical protein